MIRVQISLLLACVALIAGCGGSAGKSTVTAGQNHSALRPNAATADDSPVQPTDATWTIVCTQFKGSNHVEAAKITRMQLKATYGLTDFYVVHEDDLSTLYYGFYRAIGKHDSKELSSDELKDADRAQADLKMIRGLESKINGDPLFPLATMSPLDPVDPPAPAEWNLFNVDRDKGIGDPNKAYWTLVVGFYRDNPLRKQYAVDTVRELRAKGISNAYFCHGKTSSSICIGVWPRSAVVEKSPDRGGPDDVPLVMPQGVPQGLVDKVRTSDGETLRPVSLQLTPVDPMLLDTMRKYPHIEVNGDNIQRTYRGRDGGTVTRLDPTYLTIIPQPEPTGMLGANTNDTLPDQRPSLLGQPSNNDAGSLRSLDGAGGPK